jgi:uncharacterized surface protein with fasciclin (FAS1) repeats
MNIIETAIADGNFNTLIKLVKASGLEKTLSAEGPFTLFAPNDAALEDISSEKMIALITGPQKKIEEIILYHLLEGKYMASDLAKIKSIKTLAGYSLDIDASSGLKVDGVIVIDKDIICDNGVCHIVNGLMAP